jgi:hypothetical protein
VVATNIGGVSIELRLTDLKYKNFTGGQVTQNILLVQEYTVLPGIWNAMHMFDGNAVFNADPQGALIDKTSRHNAIALPGLFDQKASVLPPPPFPQTPPLADAAGPIPVPSGMIYTITTLYTLSMNGGLDPQFVEIDLPSSGVDSSYFVAPTPEAPTFPMLVTGILLGVPSLRRVLSRNR